MFQTTNQLGSNVPNSENLQLWVTPCAGPIRLLSALGGLAQRWILLAVASWTVYDGFMMI